MPQDFANPIVPDIELLRIHRWPSLEKYLRSIPLKGDVNANPDKPELWRRPYEKARIDLHPITLAEIVRSVKPLSLYVIQPTVQLMGSLIGRLFYEHGVDVLKLTKDVAAVEVLDSRLIFSDGNKIVDSGERRLMPPIIEYSERDQTLTLVDGIHRVWYAMELAMKKKMASRAEVMMGVARDSAVMLHVITISGVLNAELPGHMPLVPMPVTWGEVLPYPDLPPPDKKRQYAYDLRPREFYGSDKYHNFRDFDISGGVRTQIKRKPGASTQ